MERLEPRDADELARLITGAAGAGRRLEIIGGGSKRGLGRPVDADAILDTSALSGIRSYEPDELVLSAGAATRLDVVAAALLEGGQMLAFEPPDLGSGQSAGTLGGLVSAGLSGPRRIKSGAARDFILGFSAVNGRGETFKSGGRVMKNVTGYDLSKLVTGAWGTLAVLTEVTIKVMPAPETETTVAITEGDPAAALQLMSRALQSAADPTGAAYVQRDAGAGEPTVVLRLEGIPASVASRLKLLTGTDGFRGGRTLDVDESRSLWQDIRDVRALGALGDHHLWRISVPPMGGVEVIGAVAGIPGARYFCDWGGGLIWIAVPPAPDAHAGTLRLAVKRVGGHATLMTAPEDVRRRVPVFEPQAPELAALAQRVKQAFDPKGILNPGRMYEGV
jgi:glycolate oxidase FAD binding subunit